MNRTLPIAAAAAVALLGGPARAARAQSPASFGVTGGLAVPAGRLGDDVKAGYSVGGLLDFHPAPGPLSLRIEGGYDRFEAKQAVLDALTAATGSNASANVHFLRGNANVVYRLSTTAGFRPYLTGGVGVYRIGGGATFRSGGSTVTVSDDAQTKFGVNGGVGIELPLTGISTFLEARVHGVQTDATPYTYVPITVGIRF